MAEQPAQETQEAPKAQSFPDIGPPPKTKTLLAIVNEWPLKRKLGLVGVCLITLTVFSFIIIQARTADYQLLYANLAEQDGASVLSWLKGQKIPYELKNGGKNIWVPANKMYETRLDLAANGLPKGSGVGFEVFDKQSFALTDYVQKVNYTRALQGELARTIASLAPVESARVHLAIPEKRLFKNQQKKATASVIISLISGYSLDSNQVQGIVHLVSGSITGLEPRDVTVIDSNGVVLDAALKKDDDKFLSVDMLAYQQEVERRLELRSQALLDRTMGHDKAMVRVTANLDFSKVEKTEELFDSDEPVIRSQQITGENGNSSSSGGIPGVQSNLQGNTFGGNGATTGSSKNSSIINYEISKTISKIINPIGSITNLSVSVLVADKIVTSEDGKTEQTVPRTTDELEDIREMISAALGIVPERGDVINVTSMPFSKEPVSELIVDNLIPSTMLYEILPYAKIIIISLGVFFLYFLLIRPIIKSMKSDVQQHYKTVEQLERERLAAYREHQEEIAPIPVDDAVLMLRREINRDSIPASYIIKNWIHEG